jgi:hypothetical protein
LALTNSLAIIPSTLTGKKHKQSITNIKIQHTNTQTYSNTKTPTIKKKEKKIVRLSRASYHDVNAETRDAAYTG